MNRLAKDVKNDRLALALTVMSVSLIGVMLLNEFRQLFREDRGRGR